MTATWAERSRQLHDRLRLRGRPVAMKFLEKAEDIEKIPRVRKAEARLTTCQRITLARLAGFTLSATVEELPTWCSYIMGLREMPQKIRDSDLTTGVWCENKADARKRQQAFPVIPPKFQGIVISPLDRERFEPDLILVYAVPAQMTMLLSALLYKDYELLEFVFTGGSSCAVSVARCYLTGKPSLAIPDYGERRYGHVLEDELALALLPQHFDKVLSGLDFLFKAGLPYPIPPYGAQVDPYPGWPPHYQRLDDEEIGKIRKKKGG